MKKPLNDVERDDCLAMRRLCLSANLRKTERLVTRHYDEHLAPSGVTAVQLPILAAIVALEEPSFRQLAEELGLERSTLSRNLASLSERGLLSIGPSSGPKPGEIKLTPAGRRSIRRALQLWREAHADLEAALAKDALNHALTLLTRVRRALRTPPVIDRQRS
jgi:DNA-binding MarR family transcriptional regulator